ncbi:MAG: transposase [Halopseudomonas aestusnigri]
MKRRKWTSEMKSLIVLSGLKGQSVSDICNEHGISQAQYYQWRDQFLSNASKAFDTEKVGKKQARLEIENQKLKGLVGELTFELKKASRGCEAGLVYSSRCQKCAHSRSYQGDKSRPSLLGLS